MSVIGNPITIGSSGSVSNAYIVGVIVGVTHSSNYNALVGAAVESDIEYFAYSASNFTCNKSGTYTVTIGVKGCYNTSGSKIDGSIQVSKNGTSIGVVSSNGTQYNTITLVVTLAKNDVLQLRAKNNTSSANIEPCFAIIKRA